MFLAPQSNFAPKSVEESWVLRVRPSLKKYFLGRDYGWTNTVVILWTPNRIVHEKRDWPRGLSIVICVRIPKRKYAREEIDQVFIRKTLQEAAVTFSFLENHRFDVKAFMADLTSFFDEWISRKKVVRQDSPVKTRKARS